MRWAYGLALAAALAAQASAGGYNQTPRPMPHPRGAGTHGVAQPTSLTAVVSAKGGLKRGIGAVSAVQTEDGPGTYAVVFDRDITNCAYVVTIGEFDDTGTQPAASGGVVGLFGEPNGVYVTTATAKGRFKKMPFHLDVAC